VIATTVAFIDPAWALPVNTCLVIVLAIVQIKERKRVSKVERGVIDAKRKSGSNRRDNECDDNDTGDRRRWDD